MIVTGREFPRSRPGPGFQIQIADVIQDVVFMSSHASQNIKTLIVDHSRVSGSASRCWSVELWLGPMRSLQVEYDHIGKVGAVLVLSSVYQKFVSSPEVGCVAYKSQLSMFRCLLNHDSYPFVHLECHHSCQPGSTVWTAGLTSEHGCRLVDYINKPPSAI